jgi:hypothetical protein
MRFILNTALCQSPAEVSKTKKAMNFIKQAMLYRCTQIDIPKNGVHHITVIYTNNNLAETVQWTSRLGKDIKDLNVRILSSEHKENTYNKIGDIIHSITSCKNINYLPDILVMCSHTKRIDDIIELISICTGLQNTNLIEKGIREINFTIMYDEADKNINTILPLLENEKIVNDNSSLKEIHFITATPFKEFWKKLNNVSINELKSIDRCEEVDRRDENFENLLENYRSINDHIYHFNINDLTNNTIQYVSYVINKLLNCDNYDDNNENPLCVFAPASNTTESHKLMKNLFQYNDFDVIILNGLNKKIYFKESKTKISIEKFNKENKIEGELRDTLRKYKELYPKNKLCITGNRVIERGITFCTNGFNFTDVIISMYHTKNIASLVQLFGRTCGDKKYVNKMNIWCPEEVYNIVSKQIEICKNIFFKDPEFYTEKDFREKTKREMLEEAMTIPILIDITSEEYDEIIQNKKGKRFNDIIIFNIISKYGIIIDNTNLICDQKSEPKTNESYNKNIIQIINSIGEKKKWTIAIKKKNKNKDCYQMWLDYKNKKIYISFYYGTKIN